MISISTFEPENPLIVTVSSGIGSHISGEDFSETFKGLDEALYKAKNAGRNCCALAEGHENFINAV